MAELDFDRLGFVMTGRLSGTRLLAECPEVLTWNLSSLGTSSLVLLLGPTAVLELLLVVDTTNCEGTRAPMD